MQPANSRSSYEVTLLQENRELKDRNKYLREKLKVNYEGRTSTPYQILLENWQKLLIHSVNQQDEINYLTRELGKTKRRNW